MQVVLALLGALVAGIGLWGLIAPAGAMRLVARFGEGGGSLWLAVAFRGAFAVVAWLAAPETRAPGLVRAFAVLAAIAAVGLPFVGRERMQRLIGWFTALPSEVLRAWFALAALLGTALVWVAL